MRKLNHTVRNQIAKMIRAEMGYGMMETCEAIDTLIEAMEHMPNRPVIKADVGYRMKISWEEYNLRKFSNESNLAPVNICNKMSEAEILNEMYIEGIGVISKETPNKKFKVLVDIIKYNELYSNRNEIIRQNDYSKRFEEMEVTAFKLKDMLDNCIDVTVLGEA